MLEEHFEAFVDLKDPFLSWRQRFWDHFLTLGPPQSKRGAFEYVSMKGLVFPKAASSFELLERPRDPSQIVFSNGFFLKELSSLEEGVICQPLDEAIRPYGIFLQNHLSRTLKQESDPLAALNGAFQGKGVFLYVPPKVETSLVIHSFFSSNEMASPRILVYLGRGAKLNIEQKHRATFFCNTLFDAVLDQGSELILRDIPKEPLKGTFFQSIRAQLKKDSTFRAHLYAEGASLSRTSIKVDLLEENSEVLLQGLSRLEGSLQHHTHVLVEHRAPYTRSRQHFKAVLRDQSRSSFEGKIYVHPEAQKTEGYQLNNTLLLSEEASVYAKPNLEIFADDVKASHGATVAQLNKEDLFYLCSRGLSKKEATELLLEGFCRELFLCLP